MSANKEILMKFITAQNEKIRKDVSMQGYKDTSPYKNNPSNTIYGSPQGTPITMKGVSTPLIGTDEFGNMQEMVPGEEYFFPGSRVKETRMQNGGQNIYNVSMNNPMIVPSQGMNPVGYYDTLPKNEAGIPYDKDGTLFTQSKMVSRFDENGKPLSAFQVRENQKMWNMQKMAYSPEQQTFNLWKNNPQNTEQGFYNTREYGKYLKNIIPTGKDVGLDGLCDPNFSSTKCGTSKQHAKEDKKEWSKKQEGGEQDFTNVQEWFNKYIDSPLYRRNIENSGYENVDDVIAQRKANVNRTGYELDENRLGTYYKNTSNKIYNAPKTDSKNWSKQYPSVLPNDSVLAHEFGHAVLDSNQSWFGSLKPFWNKNDYDQLESRNKNKRVSRGAMENYADQKELQYTAAKLGIYNPGFEEFTEEHLDKLPTDLKDRALQNYSKEDLIWLMNNIAQNDDNSNDQLAIAQRGGATRADSLALYNNALNKIKFYKNNSDYRKDFSKTNFKSDKVRKNLIKNYKKIGSDNRVPKWLIDEMIENPKEANKPLTSTEKLALKKQLNTVKFGPVGGTNLISFGDILDGEIDTYYNPLSPPIYLHPNISPQGSEQYYSDRFGDTTDIPYYDPIAVAPFDVIKNNPKLVAERIKKYGTSGVPKSYLNKNKQTGESLYKPINDKPILQPKVEAVNIQPIEQTPINIPVQELDFNTPIKAPKSYNVNMQRYNMKGPRDYYQANEEGVDYQRAMEIKAASDAYNKYIQEKYGNEDALKNPKAAERLKQLRSEFNIEYNYKFGGDLYQYQNGSQTWDKQKQNLKNEKLEKLKKLLSLPDPVFKAKTFEEKVAEKMEQEKYKTTSKDNTTVRNYNNANKHSNAARNKTNKEFADERQAKIDAQVQANKQPFDWNNFRQSLSDRSQATGDAMRISNEPNFFDDYINPAVMIGSMADNLGQAPLRAQQEDSYMPYVTSVGAPLLTGALAGIGTKNTGQFINNVVNPLAGFGIKKGTVKGEIPKIGDDFANAIHNLDGDKIFYDTTDTSNFLKGEWKYVDELPNEGGISEVEPFNNALDELIVKATYAEKPLLTKKDFFTNKELVDKIAKERSYWDKFFKFSDEYPLSDADMVFDKKFPELKAGSFKEKFMTPEQYNYAKSKLGIFGDLGHQDITNPTIFKKQLNSDWNNTQAFDAQDFQNALRNTIFERTGKIQNANPDYLKSLIKSDEILTPELLNRMGTMENYTGNQAFKTLNANKYGGIINFLQKAQEGRTVTVDQGDGIKKKILTDSKEYSDLYNEDRIGVKNDDGSISFNPLNEVVVTPYDKQYPFYQELSDEEKKYFNDDTPIGRAVRRKAYTKNSLSEDVTDIAAPILYGTAAAMLAPYALAPLVAGLEFAGAAAAPYVEGALATSLPGMYSIPGATVGNAINAGFAGHGLYNIAPDAVEMYNNPSWSNAGNVGMDVLEIAPVAGPAGRMIGTEEGLLSNAWKLNSNAEKLNNANSSYRVAGLNAFDDFKNTGVLRSKTTLPENATFLDRVQARPTSFPSFQKGYADMRYAKPEGSVVFETVLPTFKRGDINPVTGLPIKGRHYAHRVINPETGKTMMEIPAADIKVFGDKPHWWKGYQEIKTPSVENLDQTIVSKPWEMQELPGLHLKSTMEGEAISKIVEPKTGLINTEQALAIIGKESGGADKVALIKQGLGENIPKKMDYNDFRKVVQNQLIPLETNLAEHSSNYGLSNIGYPSPKRSSYDSAITFATQDIKNITNKIKDFESKGFVGNPDSEVPMFLQRADYESNLSELYQRLGESKAQLAKNQESLKNLPLENKTIIFGNKEKFGKGSNAHHNSDETLGHAHYLINAETPDVLTITQLQSDAFQGSHRIMPKTFDPEKAKYTSERMAKIQERNKSVLNKMITEGVDETGRPVVDYEIKQMQEIVDAQELQNALQKGHVENFVQKSLLDKNHQERYLQEIVNHAAQRGDVNKVRLPTSETAANVQSYATIRKYTDEQQTLFNKISKEKEAIIDNSLDSEGFIDYKKAELNPRYIELTKEQEKLQAGVKMDYDNTSKTILKKYSEQPKLIKKLFGQDAKIVTDSKGNTWYEFDIPKNFKEGKGQIKAFLKGGETDFEKYAMKEMGGMLYANKNAGLSHEQSMKKYLSAQKNLLEFMHRIKANGGMVPFDEYYKQNIIFPRNKS